MPAAYDTPAAHESETQTEKQSAAIALHRATARVLTTELEGVCAV